MIVRISKFIVVAPLAVMLIGGSLASVAIALEDGYAAEGRALRRPNSAAAMLFAGRVFTRRYVDGNHQTDLGKAEHYLDRAVKLAPGSGEARARRGVVRALRAKDKNSRALARAALADLDRAVQLAPRNPLVRSLRGFVEVEMPASFKRKAKALEDLSAVASQLRADPGLARRYDLDVPRLHFKLGKAHRAHGQIAAARGCWQASISADPTSPEARAARRLLTR